MKQYKMQVKSNYFKKFLEMIKIPLSLIIIIVTITLMGNINTKKLTGYKYQQNIFKRKIQKF